jgi:hypothetical protein
MGEHDMQNNERDYHQHGSKKQNVSLPFENAKSPAVNGGTMIVFHCESSKARCMNTVFVQPLVS